MNYLCPVCGYNGMDERPENYAICDCCGTEFGYDDYKLSHADLRQRWIANGMPWWSIDFPAPPDWSPVAQLHNIGYDCTENDLRRMRLMVMPVVSVLAATMVEAYLFVTARAFVSTVIATQSQILRLPGKDGQGISSNGQNTAFLTSYQYA